MNKVVEINRTAIFTASEKVCKILTALINLGAKNHQDFLDLTANSVYSGDYVKERIEKMNTEYHANARLHAPAMNDEFDRIEAAGKLLENALEVTDAELAATLQIIEASNGETDQGTEELIASTFKGNQKALRIIKKVFIRFGKKTPLLDQYLFSIDEKMVFIRAHIDTITNEPYANPSYVFDLRHDLLNLCKLVGVDMTGQRFPLGEHEQDLADISMRKAMGLPV